MNDGIGLGIIVHRQAREKQDDEQEGTKGKGGHSSGRLAGEASLIVRTRDDDVSSERNKDEEVCAGTSLRDVPKGRKGVRILVLLSPSFVSLHEAVI